MAQKTTSKVWAAVIENMKPRLLQVVGKEWDAMMKLCGADSPWEKQTDATKEEWLRICQENPRKDVYW